MAHEPEVEVYVSSSGGKTVLVLDAKTKKVLLMTQYYGRGLPSGTFTAPHDVVQLLTTVATKGRAKELAVDPDLMYGIIKTYLYSNLPDEVKVDLLARVVKGFLKR